ncbi:MAG: hypothetical protein IPK61_08010 [Saprospiraceae bacterium]|nr:hypothetical protein [Saprospiraceae bacterium]
MVDGKLGPENFPSEYFKNKYLGKFTTGSKSSEIWIEGNRGQFGDGGRGDKAYFYLTKDHPNQDEWYSEIFQLLVLL